DLIYKSAVARWTRTLSTMFAAGVPLVEALDSVGGASGNAVFVEATEQIQKEVSSGSALTTAMNNAEIFEEEVDEAVKGLSSLLEPIIIVVLGTIIGGIVVSMYLPIFKLGQVV